MATFSGNSAPGLGSARCPGLAWMESGRDLAVIMINLQQHSPRIRWASLQRLQVFTYIISASSRQFWEAAVMV